MKTLKNYDKYVNEKLHGSNSPRPSIDLKGESGNAYVILGMAKNLTNQLSKVDPDRYDWTKIQAEMTSGEYNHLVKTFEEYFGDYVDIYNADVIDESVNKEHEDEMINLVNEEADLPASTIGSVTIRIDGDGLVKKWATKAIFDAMRAIQGERHIFVDGEELHLTGRGTTLPVMGYKSAFKTNEE